MNNPRMIKYEPGKNKTNHPIWLPVKFHNKIDNRRINIPRKIALTLFLILVAPHAGLSHSTSYNQTSF